VHTEVAQPDQRLFISDLPSEVLVKIFKHAGTKPRDVVRLGEVSNAWRQLSQENEIWRDLFFERYKLALVLFLLPASHWIRAHTLAYTHSGGRHRTRN
jgi:hypothetical protein